MFWEKEEELEGPGSLGERVRTGWLNLKQQTKRKDWWCS